jgi:5'-methylthioadenosine phosphorylase
MLASIGGSGVYNPSMLEKVKEIKVETPYGMITPLVGEYQGREVAFLPRHGVNHSVPPHRINYQANLWGLKFIGVERIIATTAVGSLNSQMKPGDFVLIDQFLDFTKNRRNTFFEGGDLGVVHVDYTQPYCPEVRRVLLEASQGIGVNLHDRGVYVCTEGPRFETPAEITMFSRLGGDLVGMTNVPEVVLAREVGICYATISMVTNFAAGISAGPLSHEEVLTIMSENTEHLRTLLMKALQTIPVKRSCDCKNAVQGVERLFNR